MNETYYCYEGDWKLRVDADGDLLIQQGDKGEGEVFIYSHHIKDLINGIVMTVNNEDLPVGLQYTKELQEKLEHANAMLRAVQASNGEPKPEKPKKTLVQRLRGC